MKCDAQCLFKKPTVVYMNYCFPPQLQVTSAKIWPKIH